MENQEEEISLETKITVNTMLSFVKTKMPNIAQFFPYIASTRKKLEDWIANYLGNDQKIIVAFRKGGKSTALVIDASKEFDFSNKLQKVLSKEQAFVRYHELQKEMEDIKAVVESSDPNATYTVPAIKASKVDADAVLVHEEVTSFIEKKVLGNGSVKYVVQILGDEYKEKFEGQGEPDMPSLNSFLQ